MRVLVISYGNWHGPARLPRALKRYGCEVGLVSRPNNFAAKTQFVDRMFLGTPNNEVEVIQDLVNAINAFKPDFIVPGLEPAVLMLQELHLRIQQGQFSSVAEPEQEAIRRSIFDPDQLPLFLSKIDFIDQISERGIRTPAQREVVTLGDADAFVREFGYPVVLKPDRGYAGSDVHICDDEDHLFLALASRSNGQRWCIQQFIDGPTAMVQFFAKDGVVQDAYSIARLETDPSPAGPATVVQVIENQEMLAAATEIAALMDYNGFGSGQFVLPAGSAGMAFLYEANMRLGVCMHLGDYFGIDLVKSFVQATTGKEMRQGSLQSGATIALYPQEPLRDPASVYMSGSVDIPTDDPELLSCYQSLIQSRHGLVS